MGRYQTNEIVLIEMNNALYGPVRVPAIVRYEYHEYAGYYEVNALIPSGPHAAQPLDLAYWTVTEDDIVQSLDLATVERGYLPRVPGRWLFVPDDAAQVVEEQQRHITEG